MVTTERGAGPRRAVRPVRVLLAAFCLLTAAGFVSLFVLAGQTAQTFAWTIEPPATAAFLGAGYGAGFVLSALMLRDPVWADTRVPYVTVLVFTWVTTAATFLHIDRMHFTTGGDGPVAEPAAWVWTGVYVAVPVAMAVLLPLQERTPGTDPDVRRSFPWWAKAVLGAQGLALLAVGLILFAAPDVGDRLWPWALSPFTARVVSAWLVAFGVATLLAWRVDDLARLRTATVAYAAFGALQLAVVLRFTDQVDWSGPGWPYVAAMVVITATGLVGRWLLRRSPAAAVTD